MQFTGKGSISSFLRVCLGIAWYAGFALMTFYACGFLVLILQAPGNLIELMRSSGRFIFACDLSPWGIRAEWPMSVVADSSAMAWLSAAALIRCAIFQAIVFQLRRILFNLGAGLLFQDEDPRRVRAIGLIVLAGALVNGAASFVAGLAVVRGLDVQGATLRASFGIDFTQVFVGLAVVVLGEIFRCGAAMKAEADLTV